MELQLPESLGVTLHSEGHWIREQSAICKVPQCNSCEQVNLRLELFGCVVVTSSSSVWSSWFWDCTSQAGLSTRLGQAGPQPAQQLQGPPTWPLPLQPYLWGLSSLVFVAFSCQIMKLFACPSNCCLPPPVKNLHMSVERTYQFLKSKNHWGVYFLHKILLSWMFEYYFCF